MTTYPRLRRHSEKRSPSTVVELPGRRRYKRWQTALVQRPALLILLLAPYFGEGLSGSSPPLELLLPWHLAFMVALYGCGALVCREVAYRFGLGFGGLVLLGCAYGVFEEALVDRYWFYPAYWHDSGIGAYSVVAHTNILLAVHLTAFHAGVSICLSVLTVSWISPVATTRTWANRRGLLVAACALAVTPVVYGEFSRRPPVSVLIAAVAVLVVLVALAFLVGRRSRRQEGQPNSFSVPKRRRVGVLGFGCVLAHWIIVYGIARSGLAWPAGVALACAPLALAVVAVPKLARTGPYGSDGLAAGTGVIMFFLMLDVVVAAGGRYDMFLSVTATAVGFWLLLKRRRPDADREINR